MKTTILKQSLILLSSATMLAACGGDGGDSPVDDFGSNPGESGNQSLLYSYPDDGQSEIATRAPIVLRFSSRVSTSAAEQNIILRREADGTELGFSTEEVPGEPRGVVLQPDEELDPHTRYVIDVQGLDLARGPSADREIEFSTRALQRGPKNLVTTDSDFELSRTFPSGGEQEPVMDFSTFRFQFTQPIDPATARYGQGGDATVTLTDSEGNLIDAALLVDGPYMTVDPEPEYLDTKTEYTLTLDSGLSSTYEQGFTGDDGVLTFTPKDSSPRGKPTIMVQRVTEALQPNGAPNRSELTGAPVNEVPVNSTLLGEDSATRSSGDVRAELADVTQYTEVTPVRIPRSTILTGTNIDVMIGGEVPAGISSGAVKMHFLSDATGYLVPNPYADNRDDALRIVRLFMDVAISTENAEANGGFTQDILHIELIGTAEVDPQAGVLNLDAVSVVEPDVLGQEFAYGLLSFQLQSYKDQTNTPAAFADTTPPTLQSWTLEDLSAQGGPDKSQMAKPGDPIILNFSEPLDRESVEGKVTLYRTDNNGVLEQDIDYYMDGAALVVKPEEPLRYSEELNPISYDLQLGSGITDLTGNIYLEHFNETFQLSQKTNQRIQLSEPTGDPTGPTSQVVQRSPYVLGLYPGYPCYLDPITTDLTTDDAGRCAGGIPASSINIPEDDHIPISKIAHNRPIMVSFSKDIDPNSVVLGRSFKVQRIDDNENVLSEVSGSINIEPRLVTFTPSEPWQKGQLYRYVLGSNDDTGSGNAICDGSDSENSSICDTSSFPLQTQMLGDIEVTDINNPTPSQLNNFNIHTTSLATATGGGPDMIQYFVGADTSSNVLQVLSTQPVSDSNSNLIHDAGRNLLSEEQHLNFFWAFAVTFYDYLDTEYGPTDIPDSYTDGEVDSHGILIDPNGVRPAENSAKILSTFHSIEDVDEYPIPLNSGSNTNQIGANVGCGYKSYEALSDQTGCLTTSDQCYSATPATCPDDKFTYLNSTLFGEVTNEYDPERGLKVHLYPGKVVTTSFYTILKGGPGNVSTPIQSGYQIMRMRYNKDDPNCVESSLSLCKRTKPITGWITEKDGQPVFEAVVDLYLNAPELENYIVNSLFLSLAYHNFYSYKTTLSLSGPVSFLSDGRMLIEQYNLEPVHFDLTGNSPVTKVQLKIPTKGSRLKYISKPIK